jgi:hypothetical protein
MLKVAEVINKLTAFNGTERTTAVFTADRHWAPSWAYALKINFNIILTSTPLSPKRSLPLSVSDKNYVWISHFSDVCNMSRPSHFLDFIILKRLVKSTSYEVTKFFQHFSLSWDHIFSTAPYSQTPSIYDFSLEVWDKIIIQKTFERAAPSGIGWCRSCKFSVISRVFL